MKNIAIAFASPVNLKSIQNPNQYQIFGENYDCIQTNESALIYLQRQVQRKYHQSLDFIFLIVSGTVEKKSIPANDTFAPCSHADFLRARLKHHFSRGACAGFPLPVICCKSYDEYASPEKCNMIIAKIADEVEEELRRVSEGKQNEGIRLYADMTGGYRNASMMLLSMMELLKYKGMEIGDVMYSDPAKADPAARVAPVTEIMRMFTLINGVDEFVKNGSVETIQEYFRTEPGENSPELEALLVGMQQFSDAIGLCRTDNIKDSMCQLDRLIQQFDNVQGKRLPEQLFAKILDRVADEYRQVTNPTATDINIIEWCLEKGFVQQALTLCTERLPIYFVQKQIFYPVDEAKAKKAAKNDLLHHHWEQNFVLYTHPSGEKTFAGKETACSYENFLETLQTERLAIEENLRILDIPIEAFHCLVDTIKMADELLGDMRRAMVQKAEGTADYKYPNAFLRERPQFSRLLRFIYYLRYNEGQDYQVFLNKTASRDYIIKTLDSKLAAEYAMPDSCMVLIRSLMEQRVAKKKQKEQEKIENKTQLAAEKWLHRKEILQACLAPGGTALTRCKSDDDVIGLLEQFDKLRNIRNQINHAADDGDAVVEETSLSAEAVKKNIHDCLAMLRRLEQEIG